MIKQKIILVSVVIVCLALPTSLVLAEEFIFYPDADPEITSVDGTAYYWIGICDTWENIRNKEGSNSDDIAVEMGINVNSVGVPENCTENNFAGCGRIILLFDTSVLPDECNINSASIFLYGTGKQSGLGKPDLHIASATPTSNTSLITSDYSQVGIISFGNIAYDDFLTTGYNEISLNSSGIANISKTGISKFSGQSSWDINNNFTGIWVEQGTSDIKFYLADKGVGYKPKLVVNCEEVKIPIVSVTSTFVPDSLAYTGRFFTDLYPLIIMVLGLPVGFFVLKRVIGLF